MFLCVGGIHPLGFFCNEKPSEIALLSVYLLKFSFRIALSTANEATASESQYDRLYPQG